MDSAIFTLRTLLSEEKDATRAIPDRGYTCSISELDSNEMLRELAKSGQRNGYAFEIDFQ